MDHMDNVRARCVALEPQTERWQQQTRPVERQRRWWRIPWSVAVVAALGLALALPLPVQAKNFSCGGGDVACLIAAITEANTNGQPRNTIHLAAGTYTLTVADNTTDGLNGLPSVTSILTLRGEGAESTVIERAASAPPFRLLHVTGSLTLTGLTMRGGNVFGPGTEGTAVQGAGIFNSGTLTLRYCTLAENVATLGGGIVNRGTLTLRDSTLRDNDVPTFNGFGAGGLSNEGLATIVNTTFEGNTAESGGGGLRNGGTMSITHTTFFSNVSFDGAGGLSNSGTLTITDSTFVRNAAFGEGGGLFNNIVGTLTIINTTFNDNVTTVFGGGGGVANRGTLTLINSTIAGNGFLASGGGLFNVGSGTVWVVNTILAGNIPDECRGAVTSLGHNLIGDPTGCTITLQPSDLTGDPGLDAFTDNGRPGHGHFPLLPTSQAIDAGDDAACPWRDQLGQRRVNIPHVGTSRCDIGAIEFPGKDDRQHRDKDDDHQHDQDLAATARMSQ